MELTIDFLKEHGFETNHPDRPLAKYYKKTSKYRIMVEQMYKPLSTEIVFNIECWRYDDKQAVIKKSSVSYTKDTDEFFTCLTLCNIEL